MSKACTAAGGHLVEQAFGWMVHVYPFAGDDLKVAYGMDVPKPARRYCQRLAIAFSTKSPSQVDDLAARDVERGSV